MLIDKIRELRHKQETFELTFEEEEDLLEWSTKAVITVDDVLKKVDYLDGLIEEKGDTPYHMVIVKQIRKAIESTEDSK